MTPKLAPEDEAITKVVVRMSAKLTGLVLGLICGVALCLATIWLVIKGGPHPGAHLILLRQYFPGYSISVLGSLVGFLYAFIIGFVSGAAIGILYNRLAR